MRAVAPYIPGVAIDPSAGGVAVVTGGARGIGAGIAGAAARAGMAVVVADRDAAVAGARAERLSADGHRAIAVPTDVTDYDAVERLADIAFAQGPPVQLLANNAGVEHVGLLWEGSPSSWHDLMAINLHGVYHGVRAFVPRLIDQARPASLLHTSSIAAFTTGAQQGAYQTSKRAVFALSQCVASELAGVGAPISVTVAFPGPVDTQIFAVPAPDSPDGVAALAMLQRLVGRQGMDPDEAGRLLFDAAVAGTPWVTTDVAGLRGFVDPHCATLVDIGADAFGPGA
jgi:NAD(P)-dependent dehydrogenase (short-subunit alcohol dehydrogenase family)